MRLLFFLLAVGHLTIPYALAQQVEGTVTTVDAIPIAFANIAVLNTSYGAVADENGRFTLDLPAGSYQLSVSAVGFATAVQALVTSERASTNTITITLNERSQALDEVVVTAQKTEQTILDTPVAVTLLGAEEVEATQTWELADLTGIVPNYLYQELGVGFQQIQAIRGIQVFSEVPAVATYVDGVHALDILANGFNSSTLSE